MTDNPSKTPATVFLVVCDTDERSELNSQLTHSRFRVRAYQSAGEFLLDRPDLTDSIVVADFRLPGMTGVDLYEYLQNVQPPVPVVFVTDRTDVLSVIRNTLAEFLIRPVDPEKLRETVIRVYNGEEIDKSELQSAFGQITDSEYAFFEHVVHGESSRDIAARLATSTRTVEAYRARIMDKTQADDLPDLVRKFRAVNQD